MTTFYGIETTVGPRFTEPRDHRLSRPFQSPRSALRWRDEVGFAGASTRLAPEDRDPDDLVALGCKRVVYEMPEGWSELRIKPVTFEVIRTYGRVVWI